MKLIMSKKLIIILASVVACVGAVGAYFAFREAPKSKNELPINEKEPENENEKEPEKNPEKEPEKKPEVKEEKVKVTFDTDGGNKINAMEVKKNGTLKLPTPTKDKYKFLGWNLGGKKIDDTYKFTKNSTLKATWEEYKYKCEEGWTPSGTNCIKTAPVTYNCGSDKELKGSSTTCVTINYSARVEPNRECGKKVVNYGSGHTEEVQGEKIYAGTYFCYYGVVKDSAEQADASTCRNRGHKWSNQTNKCYYDSDQNTINTCSNSNYIYISNPNEYDGVNGLNGGCYPQYKKEYKCPDGYQLIRSRLRTTCRATKEAIKY